MRRQIHCRVVSKTVERIWAGSFQLRGEIVHAFFATKFVTYTCRGQMDMGDLNQGDLNAFRQFRIHPLLVRDTPKYFIPNFFFIPQIFRLSPCTKNLGLKYTWQYWNHIFWNKKCIWNKFIIRLPKSRSPCGPPRTPTRGTGWLPHTKGRGVSPMRNTWYRTRRVSAGGMVWTECP